MKKNKDENKKNIFLASLDPSVTGVSTLTLRGSSLSASASNAAMIRWDNAIDVPFAADGDKVDIPATSSAMEVNLTTGFTPSYSVPLAEGGKAVPRAAINSIYNRGEKAIQELQAKTPQIRKDITSEGFDYTLTYAPNGQVMLHIWGAADLPAGSGSQSGGNDITIALPYSVVSEHSGYSCMLRPPAASSGSPYAYAIDQTQTSVTFHTSLYSATDPIHYHIDLTFVGDTGLYPDAPTDLTASNPSPTSVKLDWTAPTAGAPAISYNVYSSGSAESGYTLVANVVDTTWTDTSAPAPGAPNVRYYKVAGVSTAGEGFLSSVAQGLFLLPPVAPSVFVNPLNIFIPLPYGSLPPAAQIRLQMQSNGGEWINLIDNMLLDVGLTPGVGTYSFRFQYYIGSLSSDFGPASAPVDIVMPAPAVLTGDRNTRTLYWTADPVTKSFRVYQNGAVLGNTTAKEFYVASMGDNQTYVVDSYNGGVASASNPWNSGTAYQVAGTGDGVWRRNVGGAWYKV